MILLSQPQRKLERSDFHKLSVAVVNIPTQAWRIHLMIQE